MKQGQTQAINGPITSVLLRIKHITCCVSSMTTFRKRVNIESVSEEYKCEMNNSTPDIYDSMSIKDLHYLNFKCFLLVGDSVCVNNGSDLNFKNWYSY